MKSLDAKTTKWLVYGGLGAVGLYLLWKQTAAAQSAAQGNMGISSSGSGSSYNINSLDASVPGVSFAQSSLDPSILTSTLTAVPAVTASQVTAAGNFWSTLQPSSPPSSGYITFPSGTQVPASLMTGGNTRQDANGNQYITWAGQVYQLPLNADSSGNWPVRLVA